MHAGLHSMDVQKRKEVHSILHEEVDQPNTEDDLCGPLKTVLVPKNKRPLESYVEGFNFESVPVNASSEIIVHLSVEDDMGSPGLHAEILCTYEDSTEIVTINRISSTTYSLFLTPRKRGKHELVILYNSEHICGSPIPVFVTMTPGSVYLWSNIISIFSMKYTLRNKRQFSIFMFATCL